MAVLACLQRISVSEVLGVAADQNLLQCLAPPHQTSLDRSLGDLQNAGRLLDLETFDVDQEEGLPIAVVELVEGGYEGLREVQGPDHRRTRLALDRVIELYDAWGRPEKVQEFKDSGGG